MARPEKTGLDYFPMDVNIEDNLELIEAEHGVAGFGIVVKLWQKIYSHGYFIKWDNDTSLLFSRKVNTDVNLIKSVVNSCFLRSIFNEALYEKYGILTSSGIQKRYVIACHQSKRKSISVIKEYSLLTPEVTELITEETELTPVISTQRKGKESKVKKSKVKKSSDTPKNFIPPDIQEVKAYCKERINNVDPEKWHDFYTAKNWMIGKNKMRDWKAAVRTWEEKTPQTRVGKFRNTGC